MSPSESLAPRTRESLQTIQDFLGTLVARDRSDEVLTTVRQFPAREAKFRPMPAWVTSALAEAYRTKGIEQLYSHQALAAELVRDGKNVVVVTPTASGKTLCYNLPVLNAVLENPDTRALYLFPTKALAQDQLAELQDFQNGSATVLECSPTTAIRQVMREKRFGSADTLSCRIRTCCTPAYCTSHEMDAPVREPAIHRA